MERVSRRPEECQHLCRGDGAIALKEHRCDALSVLVPLELDAEWERLDHLKVTHSVQGTKQQFSVLS